METAIESGMRWGELTELRVNDLDLVTRMVTVSRKVIELNSEFHPEGLIVSTSGFQSGAADAAHLSNVHLVDWDIFQGLSQS